MRRLTVIASLVALATAAVYCSVNYEIKIRRGERGLESITIKPRAGRAGESQPAEASPEGSAGPLIRIATFNLGRLDEKKLADPRIGAVLAEVIPRFDVVALQEVHGSNQVMLSRLVDRVNAGGQQYGFATPPIGADHAVGYSSAFLYNRATIEIDRSTVQAVDDPQRQFRQRPLVALFRVKGPPESEAFTFKLVNVDTDADRTAGQLDLLDDVYKAVRDGDPGEDDVILLGDLGAAYEAIGPLRGIPDLTPSITDTPTTLRGTRPLDNILFDRRATIEFTGRAGVLDLVREFDLTWREASEVSEHMPVWAEFSPHEGFGAGHVADLDHGTTR